MPYLFDKPCIVYIYRISDPYVALYCPSYTMLCLTLATIRLGEGGSRRDITEEAKKEEQVCFSGRGVDLFLYLSTSFSTGNLSRYHHHYHHHHHSSQCTSALGRQ